MQTRICIEFRLQFLMIILFLSSFINLYSQFRKTIILCFSFTFASLIKLFHYFNIHLIFSYICYYFKCNFSRYKISGTNLNIIFNLEHIEFVVNDAQSWSEHFIWKRNLFAKKYLKIEVVWSAYKILGFKKKRSTVSTWNIPSISRIDCRHEQSIFHFVDKMENSLESW